MKELVYNPAVGDFEEGDNLPSKTPYEAPEGSLELVTSPIEPVEPDSVASIDSIVVDNGDYLFKDESAELRYPITTPMGSILDKTAIPSSVKILKPVNDSIRDIPEKITPSYVNRLYKSFENAETGTITNDEWWRRTLHGGKKGSAAFGPVQMNKIAFQDMSSRPEKYGIDMEKYGKALTFYVAQAERFLLHGNAVNTVGYSSQFDYSSKSEDAGVGYFSGKANDKAFLDYFGGEKYLKEAYSYFAKQKIKKDLGDSKGGKVDAVIKKWRGKTPEKEYVERFDQMYNE